VVHGEPTDGAAKWTAGTSLTMTLVSQRGPCQPSRVAKADILRWRLSIVSHTELKDSFLFEAMFAPHHRGVFSGTTGEIIIDIPSM
jgi:hypothetical protein